MVEAFGADPFNAVFFLTEEFNRTTRYNNAVIPKVRNMVVDHINTLVPSLKVSNPDEIGIRQSHIALNDEKLFGLYFVSNLYSDSAKNNNIECINDEGLIYVWIDSAYKYGSFIILEDVFNRVFGVPYSIFKPDLSMEREYFGDKTIADVTEAIADEDAILHYQHCIINSLKAFYFNILFKTFYYNNLEMEEHLYDVVHTHFDFYKMAAITISEMICLASIRKYMKDNLFPGLDDDNDSFDKTIFVPFLAQYMYFKDYRDAVEKNGTNKLKDDQLFLFKILNLLKTLESDDFTTLPVYKKLLVWHELISKDK